MAQPLGQGPAPAHGPDQVSFNPLTSQDLNGFTLQGNKATRVVTSTEGHQFTLTVPTHGLSGQALKDHLNGFTDDFCQKGANMCAAMKLGQDRPGKEKIESLSVQVNTQTRVVEQITKNYHGGTQAPKPLIGTALRARYQDKIDAAGPNPASDISEKVEKWKATIALLNFRSNRNPSPPTAQHGGQPLGSPQTQRPPEALSPARPNQGPEVQSPLSTQQEGRVPFSINQPDYTPSYASPPQSERERGEQPTPYDPSLVHPSTPSPSAPPLNPEPPVQLNIPTGAGAPPQAQSPQDEGLPDPFAEVPLPAVPLRNQGADEAEATQKPNQTGGALFNRTGLKPRTIQRNVPNNPQGNEGI